MVGSLQKKKVSERLNWEEYINHPFFKDDSNINDSDSYKYEETAKLKIGEDMIAKAIILKNKYIFLKKKRENYIYFYFQKKQKN